MKFSTKAAFTFVTLFFFGLVLNGQQRLVGTYYKTHTRGAKAVSLPTEDIVPHTFFLSEEPRPPLDLLVGDNETDVKANVQFLLDFAIIGHPKTATTSHLRWLCEHHEIQAHNYELHALQQGKTASMVHLMYKLPAGSQYKRGYKAPRDISNWKALKALGEYFPATKLIVGLRHPVLWFQSYYNFRVRQGYTMPPADQLTECIEGSAGVCTDEAQFHLHLSYLGKTNRTTNEETNLLGTRDSRMDAVSRLPNPVFLYETSQLRDSDNATRSELYRRDLQKYLGLTQELKEMNQENSLQHGDEKAMNICLDRYSHVRAELMKHARASAEWIQTYFLPLPDVHVSSPEYFVQLLDLWMVDPCDAVVADKE